MPLVTYTALAVVVALVCAAIGWLGIAGWLATVVVAASLAAHVAGNAIGTRLREATDRDLAARRRGAKGEPPPMPPPKPTFLETTTSLGRLVPVSATIGAACGGLAGSVSLALLTNASLAGALLGGISSGVIGALFGFLLASFVEIVRTSLREAIAAEDRTSPRPAPSIPPSPTALRPRQRADEGR
ncbi:MAG: hypothetical protein EXS06_11350 [Planctomycetaceae bacterium]|nr:hypothetical protein [Planctomycetaceae bacterium]